MEQQPPRPDFPALFGTGVCYFESHFLFLLSLGVRWKSQNLWKLRGFDSGRGKRGLRRKSERLRGLHGVETSKFVKFCGRILTPNLAKKWNLLLTPRLPPHRPLPPPPHTLISDLSQISKLKRGGGGVVKKICFYSNKPGTQKRALQPTRSRNYNFFKNLGGTPKIRLHKKM